MDGTSMKTKREGKIRNMCLPKPRVVKDFVSLLSWNPWKSKNWADLLFLCKTWRKCICTRPDEGSQAGRIKY